MTFRFVAGGLSPVRVYKSPPALPGWFSRWVEQARIRQRERALEGMEIETRVRAEIDAARAHRC